MADEITWDDFERVDLRVGTVLTAEPLEGARKPAYRLAVDFGPEIGVKHSSAQLTDLYTTEDLIGRQVLGVVNFRPKRIAGFASEVLVTGFLREGGEVALAVPERAVPNGAKLM